MGWCVVGALLAGEAIAGATSDQPWEARLAETARAELNATLGGERNFIRIHAGEAWIALGEKERIHCEFLSEAETVDGRYRIGVWRVLALSDSNPAWRTKIEGVLAQPETKEAILAIESLNKLGGAPSAASLAVIKRLKATTPEASLVFLHWAEYLAGEEAALESIVAGLASPVPAARSRAAYVLRQLRPADPGVRDALAAAVSREPAGPTVHAYVLSAALALEADPKLLSVWREELEGVLARGPDAARYEACQTLMKIYGPEDLPHLERLLADAEGDAKVGLAWAILDVMGRAQLVR